LLLTNLKHQPDNNKVTTGQQQQAEQLTWWMTITH
jgi:hypothetical protein